MRRGTTASQSAVYNIRTRLRKDMMNLAKTHRGCTHARGCGCLVDEALTALEDAERRLFNIEIVSYSDPATPRRIVNDDNTMSIVEDKKDQP